MKKHLFILILCLPTFLFSQNFYEKIRGPIWTFHTHNTTICGVSIGAFPDFKNNRFVRTNGLRLEIPGIGFLAPIGNGSPISYEDTITRNFVFTEIINGINISTGSWGDNKYNGITIGLIAQYGNVSNGLAVAGVWNAMNKSNGVLISFLANETQISNGLQISLGNSSLKTNGIQIGASNYSHTTNGVQIGLYNSSENTRGIQIGLWNKNEKRTLPFINWNFKKRKNK